MGKVMRLLPYGSVLAALVLPLAAALYLLVSTAWAVTERAALSARPA
jgi:YidC/Oxa1 family membrane protein insertase